MAAKEGVARLYDRRTRQFRPASDRNWSRKFSGKLLCTNEPALVRNPIDDAPSRQRNLSRRAHRALPCRAPRRSRCTRFLTYGSYLRRKAAKEPGRKGRPAVENAGRDGRDERNRREEDEASEIRLETSNLPESPASCKYHVCQPPLPPTAHPFTLSCTYSFMCARADVSVRARVCVSATPFSAAPSPPSFSSLLSPCPRLTVHPLAVPQALSHPSIRPTARLAALPTPDAAAPRHPRSRRPHERNSSPLQTTEALVTETP